ncbi:MAG: PTS sugar transporter subunit IIC [Elusimicrobia bacterium]|nr:PTS sugar transporter subunit IIC [Elusimicrobiota bacterium]
MATLLAALAYGILSLDHFTVGPFLLSRPLILSSLVGFLCGHVPEGIALGLLTESLWVVVPPAGPAQWDVGLAAALAGVWAFLSPSGGPSSSVSGAATALALILSIPFAVLCRSVDIWLRRQMRILSVRALEGVERGLAGPLRYGLVFAGVLWGFKSLVVFFVAEALGGALYGVLLPLVRGPWLEGLDRAWRLWPALGLAALLHQLSLRLGKGRRFWLPGGGG